jgi:PAS domain S-box-containing protein
METTASRIAFFPKGMIMSLIAVLACVSANVCSSAFAEEQAMMNANIDRSDRTVQVMAIAAAPEDPPHKRTVLVQHTLKAKRPLNGWNAYRWRIVGGTALLLVEFLLILFLFVSIRKRRAAEHELKREVETCKKARKAYRKSEARFQSLVEYANESIVVAQDEAVKYCNPRFLEMTGYTLEELRSQSFGAFIHPEDREMVTREYRIRLSGERPASRYSIRIITKDGQEKDVLVSSALIDWEGRSATLAMIMDVTEQKQAIANLQQSEERFRNLMEQSPLDIVIMTPDGQITKVNAAWMRHWGLNAEETAAVLETYNMRTDKQLEELGVAPLVERAFAGESLVLPPIQYHANRVIEETELAGTEASSRWIQTSFYSVKDENGDVQYVVSTNMDITGLKQAEEEARILRDELSHAGRVATMGELSASLAHELNQPLAAVLSNAQAARRFLQSDSPDLDEIRDILDDIIADDKRAGEVIRRLRSIMRREHEEKERIVVNQVIQGVMPFVHSEVVGRRIDLTTDLAAGLPDVLGSVVELQQVILNLILNAAEALEGSPRDRKEIVIKTEDRNGHVEVCVTDSGPGIHDKDLDRVFDAFFTSKQQGMGMGLAICRSIAESLGGALRVQNRSEGGARFCLTIPAADKSR